MIIAVDFDGTLCSDSWPEIGEPNTELIEKLKVLRESGNKIVLWTCRTGLMLEKAVGWCTERGLSFDAINDNVEGDSRKVYADIYLDDRAVDWRLI